MFSKPIKKYISSPYLFVLKLFIFSVLLFQIHRICFILYNLDSLENNSGSDLLSIFFHGFQLDLSFASYISFFTAILYSFVLWVSPRHLTKVISYFTLTIITILSIVLSIDLALYPHWGYRINSTAFAYLNTPDLALASIPTLSIIFHLILALILIILSIFLYNRNFISTPIKNRKWYQPIVIFLSSLLLIIPARGGLQTIPLNISSAYHTDKQINNHASINPFWNLMHSLIKDNKTPKPYTFFSNEKKLEIIASNKSPEDIEYLSIKEDPNILIIVWESLTSKITSQYGDNETVPFINSLKTKSVYFDNFYANGTRSDKGLVSIFSGYYPQAMKSIMKETQKARSLPSLFEELKKDNYKCSFYYGGDTNFGNMNSYFLENGVNEIIDGSYFDSYDKSNKWGTYDHVVLDRLLDDINNENEKFCKALFTITSHEPFEIPTDYKFGNNTELEKFRSAHNYTDESLRSFIEQAKKQEWWDNTLVVIMADHGHPLPLTEQINVHPDRFKIPMIWMGGALNTKDTVLNKICSQVDFSKTLLSQMRMDTKAFSFSNDIFDVNNRGFAQYIYTNGFGTLTPSGSIVFDMDQGKSIFTKGNSQSIDSLELIGKSITQHAFDDYLRR